MSNLERAIRERRSIRKFLDRPVPRAVLAEALELAQHAPSNSNIQPWHMVFAAGAARDRVREALVAAAGRGPPRIPPLPAAFQHHRFELGARIYGSMGIAREDMEARTAAVRRNFEFFGAPLVGFVCMHRDLGPPDAVGVGMFLQTLVLVLTARGVGTCVQVALAGYPEVVHGVLGIPAELSILCGLSIGYPDPDFPTNHLRVGRDPVEEHAVFLDR
jgi:nitroreductase